MDFKNQMFNFVTCVKEAHRISLSRKKTITLQKLTLDIKENNFLINLLPFIISLIPVSANKIQQGIFFYTTITQGTRQNIQYFCFHICVI